MTQYNTRFVLFEKHNCVQAAFDLGATELIKSCYISHNGTSINYYLYIEAKNKSILILDTVREICYINSNHTLAYIRNLLQNNIKTRRIISDMYRDECDKCFKKAFCLCNFPVDITNYDLLRL